VVVAIVVAAGVARPAAAVDGARLFERRCGFCHTFGRLGHRQIGPDLSDLSVRMPPEVIRQYIEQPRAVDPKSRMPAARSLQSAELDAVVRLLGGDGVVTAAGR